MKLVVVSLFCLMAVPVVAQAQSPDGSAIGVVKTWPQAGNWTILLQREASNALVCSMMTAHHPGANQQPDYLMGVDKGHDGYSLTLASLDQAGMSENSISIAIDGQPLQDLTVGSRSDKGPYYGVRAELPEIELEKFFTSLASAKVLSIQSNATYDFSVKNSAGAVKDMQECIGEAG